MRIRTAIPRDYAICASIYESAWNLALPGAQRSIGVRELENETADELTLVGVIDETVCGYISIWEPDWFIHHLYVDPATQGSGVGKYLLEHAESLAIPHSLSLKCQLTNDRAIGFYLSCGFTKTGEHGADEHGKWIGMVKVLD